MKNRMNYLSASVLILSSLFSTPQVFAANLSAPFDFENASVLPKDINSPRFRGMWLGLRESYSSGGNKEFLGSKLNTNVTWASVVSSQDKSVQPIVQASINSLCSSGIDCDAKGLGPGETTGSVNADISIKVPTYTRGITDDTTFIIALPIYSAQVDVQTGFNPSPAFQSWLNTFNTDPYQKNQIAQKFVDPVVSKSIDYGYDNYSSFRYSDRLGDMKVGAKTRFATGRHDTTFAVKYLVTLPTGTKPNANNLVDVPTGDGTYALSLTPTVDFQPTSWLTLNAYTGFTYQLADQLQRRIPQKKNESISPDLELVDRKLGNQYALGASSLFGNSQKGFAGGFGYAYQYQDGTRFSGSKFSGERYGYLEEFYQSQTMQSASALVQYSTIEYYKQKKFAVPFSWTLIYTSVFQGVNVSKSDLLSSELIMFF